MRSPAVQRRPAVVSKSMFSTQSAVAAKDEKLPVPERDKRQHSEKGKGPRGEPGSESRERKRATRGKKCDCCAVGEWGRLGETRE